MIEVRLDYLRMAESVYALAALRALEAGGDERRVIGRDEEPALVRRFEWALVEVCLQLGEVVRTLDATQGRVELAAAGSGELIFRALESAVLKRVLAEVGLERPEGSAEVLKLLRELTAAGGRDGFPRLKGDW